MVTSVSSTTSAATTSSSTSSTSSTSSSSSSSDIDWNALIEASVAAKLAKADAIDVKITDKQAEISAYQEAQSLLADLADAAQALRMPSGTLATADDVFTTRAAYLTGNGGADTDALGVTTESGASLGSHDITVEQLARAHKVMSDDVAGNTTDLGYAGVVTLGVEGGSSSAVTITADMTLDEIAEAINGASTQSGVSATVLKVSSSAYRLILSSTQTGQTITAATSSGHDVLAALGITSSDGTFANELQTAQAAILTVDGVEITRDSNEIDDVFDGVTFHLYDVTADGGSITVEVGTDLSAVKEAVQSLVDAYNAFRDAAYAQQSDTTAALFGDGTLRNLSRAVFDALNTSADGVSMAMVGLSFDATNHLVLDESTLDSALLTDLDDVKTLFALQLTTSSSQLMLLDRGTSVPSSFTLDITVDGAGSIGAVSVGGDSSLFSVSGSVITGKAGTIYEGLSFLFTGEASASVGVTASTGLAEVLHGVADAASDDDGSLQTLIDGLEGNVAQLETRRDDIVERASVYEASLTARYAKLQAQIAEANAVKDYLDALMEAQSS